MRRRRRTSRLASLCACRTHYDGFWVYIGKRKIHFMGTRWHSPAPVVELKSGESVRRHRVKLRYETTSGHEWWGGEMELNDIEVDIR